MAQANEHIKIPRASDLKIIEFYRDVATAHGIDAAKVTISGGIQLSDVDLTAELLSNLVYAS